MASLKYHKDVKRWRVFWHVTLPDGTVDKGSRSFKGRPDGERFKEKKEREEKGNELQDKLCQVEELILESQISDALIELKNIMNKAKKFNLS